MNIISHGVDLVDCARLKQSIDRYGHRFLDRVFTPAEQQYCSTRNKGRIQCFAGRFAVKEAVFKALGTGWAGGIAWTDVEVGNRSGGRPTVCLQGQSRIVAEGLGIRLFHVSISHTDTSAIGSVVAVGESV